MIINNINININKLRGIFTRSQKEIINTGDGKRNLYFDYFRKNFIKFSLDVDTTGESIFKIHKDEIIKIIYELYGNNIDIKNFGFIIVELNSNLYDGTPNLINVKIKMDDKIIFRTLLNSQIMLGFLFISRHNIQLKKQRRNLGLLNPINLEKINFQENYSEKKENKKIHIYYPKSTIYYYHALAFSKEKIKITEEEIYIFSNPSQRLLIKDIRSISAFVSTKEEDAKKYLKNYKIYGEKPQFCIEILSRDNQRLLIGRNSYDPYILLYRALDAAVYTYQNQYSHFNIDKKIISQNLNLFSISNNFMGKTFTFDNCFAHKDKRKIILKNFKDKELTDIINNIMEFKNNFEKGKYIDAIINIKNIKYIIYELEKENKYPNIINEKNIGNIKNIWEKINDLYNFENENKENIDSKKIEDNYNEIVKDNDKTKQISLKENDIESKVFDITNEKINNEKNIIKRNIKLNEEQINVLKKIINITILDYLYLEIVEKNISLFFQNNIGENQTINSNMKLILGNYFLNNFQMKKEQNLLKLGGEEFEKTIIEFNNEFMAEKKENSVI